MERILISFPPGYLVYHPNRNKHYFEQEGICAYYDELSHNQDPYIWNSQFLHSTCHITQMRTDGGQVNFWVSGAAGEKFPYFTELRCDLVFVVGSKTIWANRDEMDRNDALVDSAEAYADHYYHVPIDHPYRRRNRYTLKADENKSFQPQYKDCSLVNILPLLNSKGFSTQYLRSKMSRKFGKSYRSIPF